VLLLLMMELVLLLGQGALWHGDEGLGPQRGQQQGCC
jgi:hypothetical protein